MKIGFLCTASDLCAVYSAVIQMSHHERWLTLHCFRLVLCTLMAGKRFWNKVVASFRCSSPPKLFITTKGASCTSKQAFKFLHYFYNLRLLWLLYLLSPKVVHHHQGASCASNILYKFPPVSIVCEVCSCCVACARFFPKLA